MSAQGLSARRVRLTAGAVCLLLTWCCLVAAQEGAGPGQSGGGDRPSQNPPQGALAQGTMAKVEESLPVLYYLKNAEGKLLAVPGFTFKEFEELYKLKKQLAHREQRPRYVLQSMSITGTAGARHADLTVQVKVLAREDGWVRVPLGFDRAFLREPAKYEGPGEGFVHFEDGGQGHVGWIRSSGEERHELRLHILVPLAGVGDQTRLKLLTPRATISQLKLKVPVPKAAGKVSGGAELSVSPGGEEGATEFTVLGLGGDFELTWHKAGGQLLEQPTVLEAEGTVLARIDARGVDAQATLKVHGSGAPFDRFRVRLPPGASLVSDVPVGSNGYSVTPLANDGGAGLQQSLVEVRLTEKKSGSVEVRLATRRPHDLDGPEEWLELAGFEVVGAARQWGHVDIAADSDWQVRWGESLGVRQVERLPLEDVVAGFDYHAQPYSLTARLVPKKTRISVEPEYRLLVDADRVQLKATLKYTIRGAKAFNLDVALPGWESEEVEPAWLVAVDGITVTADDMLSIPLLQPSTRKMELQISAQWPIPEGSSSLVLPLPQPRADWLASAAVVVVPADNVELTPNHELMEGFLIRQPVGSPMDLPIRQQPPLFYRAEAAEAVFAADFRVHDRKISVDVTSQVSLDEQAGQVQQTLAYTIDYEPADYLTVEVPRSLAEGGQLEFQCDGQPVTPVVPPGSGNQQDTSGPIRMQIDLPQACIGACELKVRYPLRYGDLVAGVTRLVRHEPIVLAFPLVMPGEGRLSSNRLYVTTPPEIKVSPSDGARAVWEGEVQRSLPWVGQSYVPPRGGRVRHPHVPPTAGQPAAVQLTTDRPTSQVELELELDKKEGTTVVERAWVQTWLIPSARRDRAVFSLTSDQKELALIVPAGAVMDRVKVLLDGEQVAGRPDDGGRLIVSLPGDTPGDRYLLEVQSDFPRDRHFPGRLSIELPRLEGNVLEGNVREGNVRVDWLYWQLLVPWNEHVIAVPSELTSEFTWKWDGYFWGRRPLLDQSDLEDWVGLKVPTDGSPEQFSPRGVNCYLFSSMGNVQRVELRTAWRSWILLSASGAALVAGLLLIYVRLSRHPATLFAMAVVLLCVGMAYPEPMLLLAQAASLGLGLALLAGLLERTVARRRRATALLEPPSAVLEKASTQTHYPAHSAGRVPGAPGSMAAGAQSSTQTSPAIVSPSTSDSNA